MRTRLFVLVPFLAVVSLSACDRSEPPPAPAAQTAHPVGGRIEVSVTSEGFVPARVAARVGHPVTLAVTRRVDATCATEIVIKDFDIHRALPKDQTVEITVTPTKVGPIRFACAMDMVAGELVVE